MRFEPFTLEHFRAWAGEIVLDTGEKWVLEPFQEAFLTDLFEGRSICWFCLPEGNGKTTLTAGLGLYFLDFKPFATVLAAASSTEQAGLIFRQAEGMVLRTLRMTERFESAILVAKNKRTTSAARFVTYDGWKRIDHVDGGRFQVKAADAGTNDGALPDLVLLDELHRHRSMDLYRVLAGKLRKKNGQMIVISTAGAPGSEFEAARQAMRLGADDLSRDGCFTRAVSGNWVLHDWAVPDGTNVERLDVVELANPASWVTADTLAETLGAPGMTLQHFSRMNANLPTRERSAAITEIEWYNSVAPTPIPDGADVSLGLDVGWVMDTTAVLPLWWKDDLHRQFGEATVLVPPRDGSQLDANLVKNAISEFCGRYRVSTLVMDPSRAEDIAGWAADELQLQIVYRGQTSKPQGEDYQRFMEGLRSGVLFHSGDQALKQHAMNAVAKLLEGGGAKFARSTESRAGDQAAKSIDALAAAAMVYSYEVERRGAATDVWVI